MVPLRPAAKKRRNIRNQGGIYLSDSEFIPPPNVLSIAGDPKGSGSGAKEHFDETKVLAQQSEIKLSPTAAINEGHNTPTLHRLTQK